MTQTSPSRTSGIRITLILLGALGLGFAGGAYWRHSAVPAAPGMPSQAVAGLSESTLAVLSHLKSPVELRLHALFPDENTDTEQQALAQRVGQVVSAFEQAADGRLRVQRQNTWTPDNTKGAAGDGLVPMNLTKGDPCYLGIAVVSGPRRETLAQITPEWEPALEMDLARAIARVASAPVVAPNPANAARARVAETEVARLISNPETMTLEQGTVLLREASRQEFTAAVGEMQTELAAAQRRVVEAETANSSADRQAALEDLQQIKSRHEHKLREIVSRSQAQVEAWEQLKR